MWKYTHTDEMYHSLTNQNELAHSDIYLGQDYSDGIRHFKYVYKKKGPDGKWQYFYEKRVGLNDYAGYQKTKGDNKSKYGTYERVNTTRGNAKDPSISYRDIHTVKKGKGLFTKTHVTNATGGTNKETKIYTTTEVGKIRQGADAVASAISKNKLVKKGKKAVKKAIQKALPSTMTSTTYAVGSNNKTVTKYVNGKKVSEKKVDINKKKKK